MHIKFWNKSFCDKLLSIYWTVLTRKDGGLSGSWTCWRRRPRHCYEMPAQDLWPGGSKPQNVFWRNSNFFRWWRWRRCHWRGWRTESARPPFERSKLCSSLRASLSSSRIFKGSFHYLHSCSCRLYDVFPQGMGFVLVFEFMVSDLSEVIKDAQNPLSQEEIKGYMLMLLRGVAFIHEREVMHR